MFAAGRNFMNEWIENLERIKKLLDDGALTTDEYEQQKSQILKDSGAPVVKKNGQCGIEDQGIATKKSKGLHLVLGVSVFCLGLVGTYFIIQAPGDENGAQLVQTNNVEPIDLSATLRFSSPTECLATGQLEQIHKGLETAVKGSPEAMPLTLDGLAGLNEGLKIMISSEHLDEGWEARTASARFPDNALWHGLKIKEVKLLHVIPPDVGGVAVTQSLTFLDPPNDVKRVLDKLGFPAPLAPSTYQISEDCDQEMQIEPQPDGAALSCSYWC
jgi:hypothetical protein